MRISIKIKAVMALIMLSLFSVSVVADNKNQVAEKSVPVRKIPKERVDVEGQRVPAATVMITISQTEGLLIPGVDVSEVISYEAYDENEECIGVFYDSIEFASFVLSNYGTTGIRIELTDYYLYGFFFM